MWSPADIADAVADGLARVARAEDLEQAVYGLDARDELGLHPLIQDALRQAGYGVWPEQRYPSDRETPSRSRGRRCDLVLTAPGGGLGPAGLDGTADGMQPFPLAGPPPLPLRDPQWRGTLFDGAPAVDPEDAYWLEVKTVAQFDTQGPFRRYSAEMFAPVTEDIRKLWRDPFIRHAGLLLVLFTAERAVAEHDLGVWHGRCLERGLPLALPALRGFRITDRIGNGWCAAAVFGVRGV